MTAKQMLALSFAASASLIATAVSAGGGVEGNTRRFSANMTGAAEVPGPGDTDGTGKAILELDPGHDHLCYKLKAEGIDTATMRCCWWLVGVALFVWPGPRRAHWQP